MAMLKDKLNKYEAYDMLFSTPGLRLHLDINTLSRHIGGATTQFKIGVAHCAVKRWVGYINHKGAEVEALKRSFKRMVASPVEDNFAASEWETRLLDTFKSHKQCLNVAPGGAGVSGEELTEPYFVYVCSK